MNEDQPKSGLETFNDVPSWYEDAQPAPPEHAGAMAPPPPGSPNYSTPQQAPAASTGRRRSKSGFAGALAMKFGVFGVLALIGLFAVRGTTSASALESGDCFTMPVELEISRVESGPCNEPHDAQVVDTITLAGPEEYPSDLDPYWDSVFDQCEARALSLITNGELLPDDIGLELFTPSELGWSRDDRESTCILHSPTGLPGSFIPAAE